MALKAVVNTLFFGPRIYDSKVVERIDKEWTCVAEEAPIQEESQARKVEVVQIQEGCQLSQEYILCDKVVKVSLPLSNFKKAWNDGSKVFTTLSRVFSVVSGLSFMGLGVALLAHLHLGWGRALPKALGAIALPSLGLTGLAYYRSKQLAKESDSYVNCQFMTDASSPIQQHVIKSIVEPILKIREQALEEGVLDIRPLGDKQSSHTFFTEQEKIAVFYKYVNRLVEANEEQFIDQLGEFERFLRPPYKNKQLQGIAPTCTFSNKN